MNLNPQALLQQMINNNKIMQNPIAKNAIQMYQQGNVQELNQIANNLCKENNTTIDEMKNKIKSQFKF